MTKRDEAFEAMRKALEATRDFLDRHEESIYGPEHDIPMAAGATILSRQVMAALRLAEEGERG
jgi:hypothetical protein